MTQEVLQIIIAILGILSQLLIVGKALNKYFKRLSPNSNPAHTVITVTGKPYRFRSTLDLSFVLISAAFFSLVITDSLVISGRTPSTGIATISIVLLITLSVVGTMVGAWFLNQTEIVTGFLAITTLFVLIISPGGPFLSAPQDGEAGLWLFTPIISLVVLSSTMLIYSYGSPISNSVDKKKRTSVSLILGMLVAIAAITLGRQFVKDVAADPLTPKTDTAEVMKLLPVVMKADLNDRRNFYRLASEVSLATAYQGFLRKQEEVERGFKQEALEAETTSASAQKDQQRPTSDVKKTSTQAINQTPNPNPSSNINANVSPLNKQGQVPQQASIKSRQVQAVQEVLNMVNTDRDPVTRQALKAWIERSPLLAKSLVEELGRKQGSARAADMIGDFKGLEYDEKEELLSQRLEWIHPVGLMNQSEASIPLPGITAQDRLDAVSRYRVYQVLGDQENLRTELFREFDYPQDLRTVFDGRDGNNDTANRRTSGGDSGKIYKRTLFPKFDPNTNSLHLMDQLGLPYNIEGYVAYSQYKELALLLIQKEFYNINADSLKSIIDKYNHLDEGTQDAFLRYVVNNKSYRFEDIYRMLIDLKAIDFTPLANSQDQLVIKKLTTLIDRPNQSDPDLQLKQLADGIRSCNSRESQELLIKMLKSEYPKVPIKRLFQKQVLDLVDEVNQQAGRQDKKDLFDALADPVWQAIKDIAKVNAARDGSAFDIVNALEQFRALKVADQEGLLHQVAVSLYQPGGANSLSPLSLLIAQAKLYNNSAALLCASVIMLPLVLASIFLGGFFARKLVTRDRVRELVSKEISGYPEVESTFASPVELHGREDILRNLRNLAERGWSTIGVVGRRGVGKSRLLYALSHSDSNKREKPSVKVWVSSPSKFQEEDFIGSMFERLAFSTEGAIANFLGVKPISTRRIESRAALTGAWFYASAIMVFGIVIYGMASRLTRADIIITWLPIMAIVCASIGFFINHISKLQPVDLSTWLQRDRAHNPHTVMLYREVYDILKFLRHRNPNSSVEEHWARGNLLRVVALILLGTNFIYSLANLLTNSSLPPVYFLLHIVLAIISLAGCIFAYNYRNVPRESRSIYGHSLMSLIADYRSFAATIVYRLKQGALGQPEDRKFSLLICIDELDKIVEFEDIRAFVRRIKAIFEVPGVYYYVSLAEDTLTQLYLGPSEGKNEIDSAFDHIVRIPPLPCDIGEEIASRYLRAHGLSDVPPRLARTIATLSFGIPRDIIRRCDEFIARENQKVVSPSQLVIDLRKTQALMGYDLQQLTSAQMIDLSEKSYKSAINAQRLIEDGLEGESTERLVLSVWLISLVEITLELVDENRWKEISEETCKVGYKLPIDQVMDLIDQIKKIHDTVLADVL